MSIECIDNRIRKWASDRGLDKIEYNHNFAIASQLEEMAEEFRARGNDEKHEVIDAICDQYVYAMVDSLKPGSNKDYTESIIKSMKRKSDGEFGIGIEIFLSETLKEIESRTGAWSDEHGKWKKFETDDAKALWYKADYSKCFDEPKPYIDEDILLKALSWYQNEATDCDVTLVGKEQGFNYETLAVVIEDNTYAELAKCEIEYRAELME